MQGWGMMEVEDDKVDAGAYHGCWARGTPRLLVCKRKEGWLCWLEVVFVLMVVMVVVVMVVKLKMWRLRWRGGGDGLHAHAHRALALAHQQPCPACAQAHDLTNAHAHARTHSTHNAQARPYILNPKPPKTTILVSGSIYFG